MPGGSIKYKLQPPSVDSGAPKELAVLIIHSIRLETTTVVGLIPCRFEHNVPHSISTAPFCPPQSVLSEWGQASSTL